MSAISFARQAFSREKPHSSITDWVEILTSSNYEDEAYDGIPELVDSINLQGVSGTAEASRAIRKKLKHGNPHQQYRAMVLLKALVENCGHKFQTSFADGQLTDALKGISADPSTDAKVRKKVLLVLAFWEKQYGSDPQMAHVSGLYRQCKQHRVTQQQNIDQLNNSLGLPNLESEAAKKKREKKEAKEKERQRREEERAQANKPKRQPFDFERDKPKVLSSIVEASQATSNLINAITLVNTDKETISSNERVQECIEKAKLARKPVVRYIQLVENEELIGTLIETNERIIGALEMYDQLCIAERQPKTDDGTASITEGMAATHMTGESEVFKLQEKQRAAIQRARQGDSEAQSPIHPDLQDLSWGSTSNLPPPIKPTGRSSSISDDEPYDARGSLSDFSDYESSDEETHNTASSSNRRRNYVSVSDDPDDDAAVGIRSSKGLQDDPFADPFADEVVIGPSRR
ncbi:hypothetical protein ONZ45_g12563 [Pleurotus djamor]|nr:hypothetical protein ONZ45_g12563 [Pleurotus djamor]